MNKIDSKDQAILDTAAKHFAINGFGSARMDEIAEEAKVNKATIYYRIGDKAALYERVYASILDEIIDKISIICADVNEPATALKSYIQTIASLCETNPYMSQIVLREVASQGQHISESALKKMHEIRTLLSQILNAGMNLGHFRSINPFMIHMLIIGFINFYSAGKPIRERISDFDDKSKEIAILPVAQAAEEIADLILNSICISNSAGADNIKDKL